MSTLQRHWHNWRMSHDYLEGETVHLTVELRSGPCPCAPCVRYFARLAERIVDLSARHAAFGVVVSLAVSTRELPTAHARLRAGYVRSERLCPLDWTIERAVAQADRGGRHRPHVCAEISERLTIARLARGNDTTHPAIEHAQIALILFDRGKSAAKRGDKGVAHDYLSRAMDRARRARDATPNLFNVEG